METKFEVKIKKISQKEIFFTIFTMIIAFFFFLAFISVKIFKSKQNIRNIYCLIYELQQLSKTTEL